MGLPTITRAQGWRDDFQSSTNWSANSGSNNTATYTTDGDIGTYATVFISAVNGNFSSLTLNVTGSLSTTTYGKVIVRHKDGGGFGTNPTEQLTILYGDSTTDTFTLTSSSTLLVETFTLTAGKTISQAQWIVTARGSLSGTFTLNPDFIYFFKETLTLPTAIRPLQEQDVSIMPVIPILGRQGGVAQYIGAMSPRYIIAGGLVDTTSGQSGWTNTYTADQWWQLLKGVWVEQNTIQADGNATWQWFASDEINAKVFLSYSPQQIPGRQKSPGYHEYALSLVEFDVNGLSTANLPGITY